MNTSFKKALLYLFSAYFVTTIFDALLSMILGYALGFPSYIDGWRKAVAIAHLQSHRTVPAVAVSDCLFFLRLSSFA